MKILMIVALVLLGVLAFCYRPATILGVDGDALAHSVGGGNLLDTNRCKDTGNGRWRCFILDTRGSSTRRVDYVVKTRSFGCWDATRPGRPLGTRFPKRVSGCINLIDVVSPF
jgi:hypothetical protein